ncbi:hypothetical protein [Flammeovirga sp. SubArs3]|uniref:hypothetical protein n=1 Tax=Flammeovirga sp. SubArs3 TaxID=2995316 RepID=UPI00248CF3A7|nr:hypothetical protein [Flammeovirga sp. SubArs3]
MKGFYIGYINQLKGKYRKFTLIGAASFLILLFISCFSFGFFQEHFTNGVFEINRETTFTGKLYMQPFPFIRVEIEKGYFKDIMLVKQGKFGISEDDMDIKNLNNSAVDITGHLIYFNGQNVLEVTDIQSSDKVINIKPPTFINQGVLEVTGEIVDPKCYFGVMKPGFGKIHRSCAIRCLSGNIPAVLVHRNENGFESYFVITYPNLKIDNTPILKLIGKTVRLKGKVRKGRNWHLLQYSEAMHPLIIKEQAFSYYQENSSPPKEQHLCITAK